jgi:hypothetical protein
MEWICRVGRWAGLLRPAGVGDVSVRRWGADVLASAFRGREYGERSTMRIGYEPAVVNERPRRRTRPLRLRACISTCRSLAGAGGYVRPAVTLTAPKGTAERVR